jgi:yeast amino acid transporter
MSALGEMATWLPLGEGFQGYAARFCDKCKFHTVSDRQANRVSAFAFALGYTYLFKYLIVTPNQLTAGAMVLGYWFSPSQANPALWVLTFQVIIVVSNYIGVRWFGEIEFYLSAVKVLILLALMMFMLVMTCGGLPSYYVKVCTLWL